MPICENDDGLAAVLGHEIAHVVARHPAERMSNSFLTLGAVFAISLLFDVSGQLSSFIINLMYSLPNSRSQEVSWSRWWKCFALANCCSRLRRITLG